MTARLARSRPGSDGYRGRLMPSLTVITAGSGNSKVSSAAPVLPPGPDPSGGDLQVLDAGHARPAQRVRHPRRRPGSRRCRPPRCRAAAGHSPGRRRPGGGPRPRSRPRWRSGPTPGRRSPAAPPGARPSASASRSCSAASAGPRVSTETVPPSRSVIWTASSTAHSSCGLIGEPGHPGVHVLPVRGDHDPAADLRHPLDADADLHPGQLLTPDPGVVRVEQRRGAGHRDRHRVALAEVLHGEAGARDAPAPAAGRPSAGACRPTARSRRWSRRKGGPWRPPAARRRRTGSARRRACSGARPPAGRWSSTVSVHSTAAGGAVPLGQVGVLADERVRLHLGPGHARPRPGCSRRSARCR